MRVVPVAASPVSEMRAGPEELSILSIRQFRQNYPVFKVQP